MHKYPFLSTSGRKAPQNTIGLSHVTNRTPASSLPGIPAWFGCRIPKSSAAWGTTRGGQQQSSLHLCPLERSILPELAAPHISQPRLQLLHAVGQPAVPPVQNSPQRVPTPRLRKFGKLLSVITPPLARGKRKEKVEFCLLTEALTIAFT